ncbi:cytochrome P450 [Mangrovimicrobium sediminis]|nr:cytochrome P450 [Haliea sp. SAOS-164]
MPASTTDDIGYDPFDVTVMGNPYPYYQKLRAQQPVYYTPQYDTYWLSRYADIEDMLQPRNNSKLVSSESSIPMPEVLRQHHAGKPPQASLDPMAPMTLLHSPHYDEVRRAHAQPFTPRAVAQLEDFARRTTRELLAPCLARGEFDLFLDYGGMLSALLTCRLFDIDPALAPEILETVNATTAYDPERGGIDNAQLFLRMQRFMLPSVARRRAAGADGSAPLFDGLINYRTNPDGRALRDEEICDQLTCAFVANTETPGKVAAQGLLELSRRPQQLAEVRADLATNVPVAAEEMLRYCAPAQWFLRTVHEDVEIAGVTMRAGQRVAGLINSANRDEREYENSEEFIWNRPIRKQLAFGMGQHHCLGLHIARLQIRVLVEEFLARVESYEFDLDRAVLRPSYFHCAYTSLPVRVTAR